MMIELNEVAFVHRKVYNQVVEHGYFLEHFYTTCDKYDGAGNAFGLQNPEDICAFWNDFWFSLPDNRSIHIYPFDDICDLAEGSYLIGDVDE